MGTPRYMRPELAEGAREASTASDVWAFAVLAVEVLTAREPFVTPPFVAALDKAPLPEPVLDLDDAELVGILRRCLTTDRASRPTLGEVKAALSNAQLAS